MSTPSIPPYRVPAGAVATPPADSQQFQEALLDSVRHPIIAVDSQRTIIYWNAAAELKYGWTAAEALGRTSTDLIKREETPAQMQEIVDTLLRGESWSGDFEVTAKNGAQMSVHVTNKPVFDEQGRLYAIIGVSADASERRRLSAIVESSGDAIMGWASDGTASVWNASAERLFGYAAHEIIGQPASVLVPEMWKQEGRNASRRVVEGGPPEEFESALIHKNGSSVDVRLSLSPMLNDEGDIVGVSAIAHDITVRRQAQRQATFQANLLDVAGQAIIATDREGAITYWNRAAEELYGWPSEEVQGRLITEVTPSEATQEQAAEIMAALLAGQSWYGEFAVQRRDGTTFPAFVTDTPIVDDAGEVVGVIGVSTDVTDRRVLEDRVRQVERLESLGLLAGGVAHDFNNLLNVILNYAKFVEAASEGEVREDTKEIIAAGESAARLTRQLLTFARREAVELQTLDLNAVLEDVHGLLARSIGEDIHLIVRPSPLPTITADRGQIEQIMLNLAVNARDAMPDGGTLTIETAVAEFSEEYVQLHPDASIGRYVQLAVSDTGTGMPPEVAARAFEPFFTTKEKHSGTGLGLATIHGIVTGAGGTINLYSENGLGTTIRIYFPIDVGAVASEDTDHRTELKRGHGESVLVIEDHDAVRALTVRMLRRNGYDVAEANGPLDALEQAANHQFDLVLTDVIMPVMSGRAVAERIRVANPQQAVLYMSGYSDGVLGPSRVLDPGVALVQKPFTEVVLLEAVSAALV